MAESRSDSIDRMLRELKAQIEQLKAGVDRFTTDSRKHRENEKDGRTLFIKIHRENFPISWEELERVFSRFGMIEYTEISNPGGNYHSKVRFQNRDSTIRAFDAINHRDIYDGCCRMELSIDAQTGSRTSEIETPMGAEQLISCDSTVVEGLEVFQDEIKASNEEVDSITQVIEHFMGNPLKVCEEGEALDQEIKHITNPIEEPCQETESEVFSESLMASMRMVVVGLKADESKKSPEAQFESSKVLSCFTNAIVFEEESESMAESAEVEVPIETELVDFWNAYNLFDEMPKRSINVLGSGSWNFDPEGVRRQDCMCWDIVVDRALMRENASNSSCVATIADRGLAVNLIFDPGIWESCTELSGAPKSDVHVVVMKGSRSQDCLKWYVADRSQMGKKINFWLISSSVIAEYRAKHGVIDGTLIFDPGIVKLGVVSSKCFKVGVLTDLREGIGVSFLTKLDQFYAQSSSFGGPKFLNNFPIIRPFDRGKFFDELRYFFPFVRNPYVCIEVDSKRLQWDPGILNSHFRKRSLSCKGSSGVLCGIPVSQVF